MIKIGDLNQSILGSKVILCSSQKSKNIKDRGLEERQQNGSRVTFPRALFREKSPTPNSETGRKGGERQWKCICYSVYLTGKSVHPSGWLCHSPSKRVCGRDGTNHHLESLLLSSHFWTSLGTDQEGAFLTFTMQTENYCSIQHLSAFQFSAISSFPSEEGCPDVCFHYQAQGPWQLYRLYCCREGKLLYSRTPDPVL